MHIRPIHRICDVRGCRNKDCYTLTMTREYGNSVIICKDCLNAALKAINNGDFGVKDTAKMPPPPLFFNIAAHNADTNNATNNDTNVDTDNDTNNDTYTCKQCGKSYHSMAALNRHISNVHVEAAL